ncbi:MAG: hypothetical protein HY046_01225, partial [Acidobacteria bacterium]|nr:hypothetical protein [Acidobacteriota bacterium]
QMAGPSIIRTQSIPTDADVLRVGEPRFHALRTLADEFGFQLIYVIMPCRQPGEDVTQQLGQKASVPVLLPVRNFELSKEMYRDTIHLNAKGASAFTDALIKSVNQFVASQNPPQQKQ